MLELLLSHPRLKEHFFVDVDVFDKEELSILFKTSIDNIIDNTPEKDEKLTAFLIKKEYLININKQSINEAIKALQQKSAKEINKIKDKKDISYKNGLKFAFWTFQHSNSTLYLKKINNKVALN